MRDNFQASLHAVLKSEGGNDDDPADHGGRTSRGITQREYNAWLKERGRPFKDVWTASDEDVAAIYLQEYWLPLCDGFPLGVDYLYFDTSVLAGPHRAATLLQRALGLSEDGRVGPITRQAVGQMDPAVLIQRYSDAKARFYKSLNQPRFTKGWLNRVIESRATALGMIRKGASS